jgi:uncharacterized protein (TIGR02118 family)
MISRMGLLKKKAELSSQEFRRHWIVRHGPLAKLLPGLRGYVQNHVLEIKRQCVDFPQGAEQFDGFSQLWFADREAMKSAIETHFGPALSADEALFIGSLYIIVADQSEVIVPERQASPLIKCLSLLRRLEEISGARFRELWCGDFVRSMSSLPGVRGYRQNIIFERQVPKGTIVDYGRLPIDGVSEIWFESNEALENAFSSKAGRDTVVQAKTFIAEATSFFVDEHAIM